jgi:hypothetical protein
VICMHTKDFDYIVDQISILDRLDSA